MEDYEGQYIFQTGGVEVYHTEGRWTVYVENARTCQVGVAHDEAELYCTIRELVPPYLQDEVLGRLVREGLVEDIKGVI